MVKRVSQMHKLTGLIANKNQAVKAGIMSDKKYVDGTSVAQAAFENEYGTKEARPRPFFRNAINANRDKWKETLFEALKHTGFDINQALSLVGEEIVGDIRESIISGHFVKNSPVTLLLKDRFPMNPEDITPKDYAQAVADARKGISAGGANNKPLRWTGTLLNSITWEVGDES